MDSGHVHRKSLIKLNNEVMNNNRPPAPKSRKWLMRNNKSSLSGLIPPEPMVRGHGDTARTETGL